MSNEHNERNSRGFNWADLITTIIGCFLGLLLLDLINIRTAISNIFLSTVVSVIIISIVILAVKLIVFGLMKLIKK